MRNFFTPDTPIQGVEFPEPTFDRLPQERRLFNQPEWIANADLTFDQEEWGTKFTFAFFAISDVLTAAGSATEATNGGTLDATLDRYADTFKQIDIVWQQSWKMLDFKFSAKNLTDSERRIVYDDSVLLEPAAERTYKRGRDYSLSLTYRF